MADLRLVCLHGLGRGRSDWDAVRPGLEACGRVSVPCLPRGSPPALDLAPDTVLIGHSLGGLLALRLAAGASQPPMGVVLTGCPFPVARNGRTRLGTALGYAGHRDRVRALAAANGRRSDGPAAGASPAGLPGIARVLTRPGRFDALAAAVAAPVLVVHARDDHHVPFNFALAAAARHAWDVRLLDQGGHHAHLRTPGRLAGGRRAVAGCAPTAALRSRRGSARMTSSAPPSN